MSSKKNSDKETFSLPKTVSFFGTQKALQKLVDMRGEYSRAAEPPVQCGVSHLSRRTEPHCL